jgi:hypothetical protein
MNMLSELQQRILAELEEAGEDDVPTLMNAVMSVTGAPSDIGEFKAALVKLCDREFICMSNKQSKPLGKLACLSLEKTKAEVAKISAFLIFDDARHRWIDGRRVAPPYLTPFPMVVLTENGLNIARQLLDERGYQWWRPIKP